MFDIFDGQSSSRPVQDYGGTSRARTNDELFHSVSEHRRGRQEQRMAAECSLKIQCWFRRIRAIQNLRNRCTLELRRFQFPAPEDLEPYQFRRVTFLLKYCEWPHSPEQMCVLSQLLNTMTTYAVEIKRFTANHLEYGSIKLANLIIGDIVQICIRVVLHNGCCFFQVCRLLTTLWTHDYFNLPVFGFALLKLYALRDDYLRCVRRLVENLWTDSSPDTGEVNIQEILIDLSMRWICITTTSAFVNNFVEEKKMRRSSLAGQLRYADLRAAIMRSFVHIIMYENYGQFSITHIAYRYSLISRNDFPRSTFYRVLRRSDLNEIHISDFLTPFLLTIKPDGGTPNSRWSSKELKHFCSMLSTILSTRQCDRVSGNLPPVDEALNVMLQRLFYCKCCQSSPLLQRAIPSPEPEVSSIQLLDVSSGWPVPTFEYNIPELPKFEHARLSTSRRQFILDICYVIKTFESSHGFGNSIGCFDDPRLLLPQDCLSYIESVLHNYGLHEMTLQKLRGASERLTYVMSVLHKLINFHLINLKVDSEDGEIRQADMTAFLRKVIMAIVSVNVFFLRSMCSPDNILTADRLIQEELRPTITNEDRRNFYNTYLVTAGILRELYNQTFIHGIRFDDNWYRHDLQMDLYGPVDHIFYFLDDQRYTDMVEAYLDSRYHLGASYENVLLVSLIKHTPFILSFKCRKRLAGYAPDRNSDDMNEDSTRSERIRRLSIYEDAFNAFHSYPACWFKSNVRVNMVNEAGAQEAGIDQGGLFKEFIVKFLEAAFHPSRNLFGVSAEGNVYPVPLSDEVYPDFREHLRFIGCMLGKLIYDGFVCTVRLADFFLVQLVPHPPNPLNPGYLKSYDAEMYKNLSALLSMEDVESLGLDFTYCRERSDGSVETIPLKLGGGDIAVTNYNVNEYVTLLSEFKMQVEIQEQVKAFRKGFLGVFGSDSLSLFCTEEIHLLISGQEINSISVDDWQVYCRYSGFEGENVQIVKWFWSILYGLSAQELSDLLMFTTGLPKPPALGFMDFQPNFTLCGVTEEQFDERLPWASTCTNTLYLPTYQNKEQLRHKLLQSIQFKSGFERT